MAKLSEEQIAQAMEHVPGWERVGDEIQRTFTFKNFREALAFTVQTGLLAERMDHHPDIDIRYKTVHLSLSTHSAGGLTNNDFELAEKINKITNTSGDRL
jgi:4a-hydroxytetrahydrobiopterin dehydratase